MRKIIHLWYILLLFINVCTSLQIETYMYVVRGNVRFILGSPSLAFTRAEIDLILVHSIIWYSIFSSRLKANDIYLLKNKHAMTLLWKGWWVNLWLHFVTTFIQSVSNYFTREISSVSRFFSRIAWRLSTVDRPQHYAMPWGHIASCINKPMGSCLLGS